MSLDALKAEIATKRKLVTDENSKPSKYMRRGELEKLKEEEELKRKEAASAEESSKRVAESSVCRTAFDPADYTKWLPRLSVLFRIPPCRTVLGAIQANLPLQNL